MSEPLFHCEGRPVFKGDKLHVAPRFQSKAGSIVTAEFKAYGVLDGEEVTVRTDNGAVPTVPVSALSWKPHPDVTDRQRIQDLTGMWPRNISDRDLRMFRLGRDAAHQATKEPSK